ncbi:hypothetical protein A3F06_01080 [candidate division TM6 bacterium RIFCSPHIGHO2_12_FULL_36_22]|nr:MAG: hypothetical protein A3F06_01080 [candidate division TM6 bacterium RIFCSPHIGHO2_12_FULL_36_22]
MTKQFWTIGLILWLGCIIGSLALIPYILHMLPVPPEAKILPMLLQNSILYAIASFAGLYFAQKSNFHIWPNKQSILISIGAGIGVGIILLAIELILKSLNLSIVVGTPPAWQYGLLAAIYGAINEEVLLRLFLMSFIIWFLQKLTRSAGNWIYWISIIIVALLFGIGHIPAVKAITKITPAIIAQILILNSIAGVIFGYLYWKYNLVSAMLAHGAADIILHVLGVLLLF